MKNTKKAFTLVELIVVISILAILGTIWFISLQGYSWETRDVKRLSDVTTLLKKIEVTVAAKGTPYSSLVTSVGWTQTRVIGSGTVTTNPWKINFTALKDNWDNFKDNFNDTVIDYPTAYAMGGTGSGAFNFIQIATINETQNKVIVVGNYVKLDNINDSEGLISSWTVTTGNELSSGTGFTTPVSNVPNYVR